jgi:hypothetical protein
MAQCPVTMAFIESTKILLERLGILVEDVLDSLEDARLLAADAGDSAMRQHMRALACLTAIKDACVVPALSNHCPQSMRERMKQHVIKASWADLDEFIVLLGSVGDDLLVHETETEVFAKGLTKKLTRPFTQKAQKALSNLYVAAYDIRRAFGTSGFSLRRVGTITAEAMENASVSAETRVWFARQLIQITEENPCPKINFPV